MSKEAMIGYKISIIIPIYNIRDYLSKCVESLSSQTYSNIEIILVDDGSTDSSGELCNQYAARDSRVRVIHKQNGGASSARNAGLDAVSGQYIMFLDGDDYLAPDALQRLAEIAVEAGDFDFVQFHYTETDGSWQGDPAQPAHTRVCTDPREMFRYLYQKGGVAASPCTKLYRASLFETLRFQEGIAYEDEELITRLLPRCRRVVYTELILYGYVMRGDSSIHAPFNTHKLDVMSIMDERLQVLRGLGYDEFVQETRRRQFCTAAMLYCQARCAGADKAAAYLKKRLQSLSKDKSIPLAGQYLVLCRLLRVTPFAAELYYLARRLCGKS